MSKFGSIFLSCIFFLAPHLSGASGEIPPIPAAWTAQNSVEYALAHSPDGRIALQRMDMATADLTLARGGYYPQVDISAAYGQTNNPMYSFGNILNQGVFTPGMDFNSPGRTDNTTIRMGMEYRFYNGGRDQASVEAAEAEYAFTGMEREEVFSRLAFEVVRSYHAMVQARDMLEARKASVDAIRASLRVATARFNAGDLLKADLLNLEVEESSGCENLILAEHQLELSQKIFLNLLGLKEGSVVLDTSDGYQPHLPEKLSYSQRPELKKLIYAEESAKAKLRVARGARLPTVDGFASYQYDKGFIIDGNGDSWMAGVKVNYRLFDGNRTGAAVAKCMAELASVQAQREKLELGLDLEVKRADLNHRQVIQRLQVTKKMVEQAEESARLSRTRFKEGVILSSELIDVEMRLTDARVRHSVANAEIHVAKADLRRAMGLAQFEENPGKKEDTREKPE